MAGNTFVVSNLVAKEALTAFNQESMFLRTVDNTRSRTFQPGEYNSGSTIQIKIPALFNEPNTGNNLVIQGITQSEVPLSLYQFNDAIATSLAQNTYDISKEQMVADVVTPLIQGYVRSIERFFLTMLAYQSTNLIGTPGTDVSSPDVFSTATAQMAQYLVPAGQIYAAITPFTQSALFGNNKSLYNPNETIGEIYLSGEIKMQAGIKTYSTNNVPTISTISSADLGTPVTGTISADGATLQVTGMTGSATIPAGTKFTIAGIYGVDPQSKQRTTNLQVFTVYNGFTQSATGMPTFNNVTASGGTASLPISPVINSSTTSTTQTVNASPAPGTAITFVGASGVSQTKGFYTANVAYHPKAFQLASAPLAKSVQEGISTSRRDPKTGIDILVNQFFAGLSTSNMMSISSLMGGVAGRPMWSTVLAGA